MLRGEHNRRQIPHRADCPVSQYRENTKIRPTNTTTKRTATLKRSFQPQVMSALGSKSDMAARLSSVRFIANSGHRLSALGCRLSAKSGILPGPFATAIPDWSGDANPVARLARSRPRARWRKSFLG